MNYLETGIADRTIGGDRLSRVSDPVKVPLCSYEARELESQLGQALTSVSQISSIGSGVGETGASSEGVTLIGQMGSTAPLCPKCEVPMVLRTA